LTGKTFTFALSSNVSWQSSVSSNCVLWIAAMIGLVREYVRCELTVLFWCGETSCFEFIEMCSWSEKRVHAKLNVFYSHNSLAHTAPISIEFFDFSFDSVFVVLPMLVS